MGGSCCSATRRSANLLSRKHASLCVCLAICSEKMADFKAHLDRQGKRLDVDMSVQVSNDKQL